MNNKLFDRTRMYALILAILQLVSSFVYLLALSFTLAITVPSIRETINWADLGVAIEQIPVSNYAALFTVSLLFIFSIILCFLLFRMSGNLKRKNYSSRLPLLGVIAMQIFLFIDSLLGGAIDISGLILNATLILLAFVTSKKLLKIKSINQ